MPLSNHPPEILLVKKFWSLGQSVFVYMNQDSRFWTNATPGPVSKVYRNAGLLMGNQFGMGPEYPLEIVITCSFTAKVVNRLSFFCNIESVSAPHGWMKRFIQDGCFAGFQAAFACACLRCVAASLESLQGYVPPHVRPSRLPPDAWSQLTSHSVQFFESP